MNKIIQVIKAPHESVNDDSVVIVDVFVKNNICYIMEINPRFGGGYPLSHHVGANFPKKSIKLLKGITISSDLDDFYEEGVLMLKKPDFVFSSEEI